MGIFSLPFKKPPLGLPWTIKTINILDPLGVPFFAEEKVPLIQTVLGKAQVRTSPEQNKGASRPSARRWVEDTYPP